jgi:predicted ATPase/DNA-binding SARP family transcriptional activator/class 3 adenylate cyclase
MKDESHPLHPSSFERQGAMDALWRIELLGGLRAVPLEGSAFPGTGGRVITRFRTHQTGALLAYLAYHRQRSHPREFLIELCWPEAEPESGRNLLSKALSSLRHQLEPPGIPADAVITADRTNVGLNPATVTTDVAEFEALMQAATRAGSAAERTQNLIDAVSLYHGDLLPGYYEEWILPEQGRLTELFFQALRQLVTLLERAGDLDRALQYAGRAITADPLREEAHRELIRLYAAAGRPDDALRQYSELERLWREELGSAPSAAAKALAREIEVRVQGSGFGVQGSEGAGRGARSAGQGAEGRSQKAEGSLKEPAARSPKRSEATSAPVLPTGTVTFLLTDIEGSTALWEREGAAFEAALARHHALFREEFRRHAGWEVQEAGDSFIVAFAGAGEALACAIACQESVGRRQEAGGSGEADSPDPQSTIRNPQSELRVRMALHSGDVDLSQGRYRGFVLHYASRVMQAAHGGQILCSEATAGLLPPAGESGVRLISLGVYRLRDVSTPVRLFLVEYPGMPWRDFPRPRAQVWHTGGLPVQVSRFFGREGELARLRELLEPAEGSGFRVQGSGFGSGQQSVVSSQSGEPAPTHHSPLLNPEPSTRLVTLTGPGGTGKTRLALAAAEQLQEAFQGAVWFAPLADVSDPQRIADAVLESMALPHSPSLQPLDQVVDTLSRQPSLLVLDNLEQLVAGAAEVVRGLSERVPDLKCLVTSRQRLDLQGEREFPVPPLPTPDAGDSPERLILVDSVRLFVDRAQAVRPDFQITGQNAPAIAELCARLEGIPLALELAAARVQVLTPAQMLAQLEHRFDFLVSRRRDVAERHRTLRAAIEWSYRILSPDLQQFFACLSVFRGGWALEAADAVVSEEGSRFRVQGSGCGSGQWSPPASRVPGSGQSGEPDPAHHSPLTTHQTLDALEQLRECSLIQAEETVLGMRFAMLETLREFAAEQLPAEARDSLARRHAEWYLGLAELQAALMRTREEARALDETAPEFENLRSVMRWVQERGGGDLCVRLALALYPLLYHRGFWGEARRYLEAGIRCTEAPEGSTAEARRLQAALRHYHASLSYDMGEAATARADAEAALALRRELDDPAAISDSLNLLGLLGLDEDDTDAARLCFETALGLLSPDDQGGTGKILHNLALLADRAGDPVEGQRLYEESLARRRTAGDARGEAVTLGNLGVLAHRAGDLPGARRLYRDSLALRQTLRDQHGIATMLNNLGELAEAEGDLEGAVALYTHAENLYRDLQSAHVAVPAGNLQRLASRFDPHRFAELRRQAQETPWEESVED